MAKVADRQRERGHGHLFIDALIEDKISEPYEYVRVHTDIVAAPG